MWTFFATIGAGAVVVALTITAIDGLIDEAYQVGYKTGRASVPDLSGQCVAYWFSGDPVLADKKLKAACAARKETTP